MTGTNNATTIPAANNGNQVANGGDVDTQINVGTVNISVTIQGQGDKAPSVGGMLERAESHSSAKKPVNKPAAINRSTTPSAKPPQATPTLLEDKDSKAPVSGTSAKFDISTIGGSHHIKNDFGNEVHTITDKTGDTAVVIINRETGVVTTELTDTRVRMRVSTDNQGFSGERRIAFGYGTDMPNGFGMEAFAMSIKSDAKFDKATIYCDDKIPFISLSHGVDRDTATTTNTRVDKLTQREMQAFFERNPDIATEMAKIKIRDGSKQVGLPVIRVGGGTLTMEELGKMTPPKTQACPVGRADVFIGSVK